MNNNKAILFNKFFYSVFATIVLLLLQLMLILYVSQLIIIISVDISVLLY